MRYAETRYPGTRNGGLLDAVAAILTLYRPSPRKAPRENKNPETQTWEIITIGGHAKPEPTNEVLPQPLPDTLPRPRRLM